MQHTEEGVEKRRMPHPSSFWGWRPKNPFPRSMGEILRAWWRSEWRA